MVAGQYQVHSPFGETGRRQSCRIRQATYAEMVIALEADTQVHLGGPRADLARKITLLRNAIRFIMKQCQPKVKIDGKVKVVSFSAFFTPKLYLGCVEPLLGIRLPGIFRGIRWNQGGIQIDLNAANLWLAKCKHDELRAGVISREDVSGLHDRGPPFVRITASNGSSKAFRGSGGQMPYSLLSLRSSNVT